MTDLEKKDNVSVAELTEETVKVTDSWVKLISVVGVPSVIALYLVYQFTTAMQSDIKKLNEAMPMHVQATQQLNTTNERILSVLQNICANQAKDNSERNNCFAH